MHGTSAPFCVGSGIRTPTQSRTWIHYTIHGLEHLRSHVGFSTTVMPSKPVPVRSPGASQLPILLISASESSKFMDDFNSTFYQGFLWVIAISHLQLPQRLDTLRLYRGSCDELHTPEAKQRLVQMILIYTKLSGHNRWWRQGK
jgi:hypothetical protein